MRRDEGKLARRRRSDEKTWAKTRREERAFGDRNASASV